MALITFKRENYSKTLLSGLSELYVTKQFCDVTLKCSGDATFQAHRVVLASGSSVLRKMLSEMPTEHPSTTVILLPTAHARYVEPLLNYLYTGTVNVRREDLKKFLRLASSLDISGLTNDDIVDTTSELQTESSTDSIANISPSLVSSTSKDISTIFGKIYSLDVINEPYKEFFNVLRLPSHQYNALLARLKYMDFTMENDTITLKHSYLQSSQYTVVKFKLGQQVLEELNGLKVFTVFLLEKDTLFQILRFTEKCKIAFIKFTVVSPTKIDSVAYIDEFTSTCSYSESQIESLNEK